MKNIIKSIVLIILLIISTSCKSTSNKELNYDNFDLAIMVEGQDGQYTEWKSEDWPDKEDYTLNTALSTCDDGSSIEWDDEKGAIYLTSNNWDKCTAKFDKIIKIQYIEDLVELSNRVNGGDSLKGKTIKLMRDLDFKKADDYKNSTNKSYGDFNKDDKVDTTIFDELTKTEGAGFAPIGTETNNFEGNFDGNNHKLSNLYVNNAKNIEKSRLGLFGVIKDSEVFDLTVSGTINNGTSASNAGLISDTSGIVRITNVTNETNITSNRSNWTVGGVIGTLNSDGDIVIENCKNRGVISGGAHTGGIMGGAAANSKVMIKNTVNYGEVKITDGVEIGGVLGIGDTDTNVIIDSCQNHGEVKVTKSSTATSETNAGGLTGLSKGSFAVKDSFNYATITLNVPKSANVGGIIGKNLEYSIIENAGNEGNINVMTVNEVQFSAGGVIGTIGKKTDVFKTYNKGNINNLKEEYLNKSNAVIYISGIIANNSSDTDSIILEECYNTGNLSGGNRIGGLLGTGTAGKIIINKSYNTGNITNGPDTGLYNSNLSGLVSAFGGDKKIIILNSYNIGDIYNSRELDAVAGLITTNFYPNVSIINSYNLGNNTNSIGRGNTGILINWGNNSEATRKYEKYFYINNVYNANELTKFTHSIINWIGEYKYQIRNTFFYNNSSSSQDILDSNIISKELEEIKSQSFVDTLNKNIESINIEKLDKDLEGYMLSKWMLGSDGYPTLEGVGN